VKGISTIIATIILLIITIGLAGTSYLFVSNILSGRMAKVVTVLGSSCNGTHITLVISNDGTSTILPTDVNVLINNQAVGTFGKTINSHESEVNTFSPVQVNQPNSVLIISPSNSVKITVWC
jgi:hypothetical protein